MASKHMRVPGLCWHTVQTYIELSNKMVTGFDVVGQGALTTAINQLLVKHTIEHHQRKAEEARGE